MYKQASYIIKKCGGASFLSKALQVSTAQIYKWTYPKSRGGTDGLIPARHQISIYELAKDRGIDLAPDDFFKCVDGDHDARP